MLSAPQTDPAPPAPAAVRPEKLDTNEQGKPVPYLAGEDWFAVTWIQSRVYADFLIPDKSQQAAGGKGGKGGGSQTSYIQAGTMVGLVCLGPLDFVDKLEIGGDVVWQGYGVRGAEWPHYFGTLVPNVVGWRLYWGTEDQPADDLIFPLCGEEHPRYAGFAYLILKDMRFGPASGTVTPQNVRVHVGRAPRHAGLDEGLTREGANPITIQAELVANDFYGLGRPDLVDVATAGPRALAIKRTTEVTLANGTPHTAQLGYVSLRLDGRQAFGSIVGALAENYDGWLRRKGAALEWGAFPHDGVEPEGLLELSLHDFEGEPRFANPGPDHESVITDAIVRGPDRDWDMDPSSETWPNMATRDRLQEIRTKTFERPHLINGYQRAAMAQRLALVHARPEQKIDGLRIRREKLGALREGDLFIVNYGPTLTRQIFRITRRTDPAAGGVVSVDVTAERGLAPLAYIAPPHAAPALPEPAHPATIVDARVWQFSAFGEFGAVPTVAILAARPNAQQSHYAVHFSAADDTYDELTTVRRWAIHGTLVGAIAADALTCTVAADGPDIALLETQSDSAAADDTLLLVVDGEACAIGASSALGGGQYTLDLLRGRRSSAAAAHAAGAEVYIIARADLVPLQHAAFPVAAETRYFKLAPSTTRETQALAEALKLTYAFAATVVAAPSGLLLSSGNDVPLVLDDGTVIPRLLATWTAPANAEVQARGFVRVQWARLALQWADYAVMPATQTSVAMLGLSAGVDYYVRVRAELDGVPSDWVQSGPHLLLGDTTPPAAPTITSATAHQGWNELKWSAPADYDVKLGQFLVYRGTSSANTFLGRTRDLMFADSSASAGQTYKYAVSAEDGSENEGPKSAEATITTATPPTIPDPGLPDVVPANPSAASKTGEGTRTGGDGTVYAYFVMSVPALPANATWQNVLVRVNEAGEFAIAAQIKNTSAATVRVENLIPGKSYQVATQAWNGGHGSAVVQATGAPYTALNDTADPAPPTGCSLVAGDDSALRPPPALIGTSQGYACTVKFTDSPDKAKLLFYQIVCTAADNDGAASIIADSAPTPIAPPGAGLCYVYESSPTANPYIRIRAFSVSSRVSAWVRVGDASTYFKLPLSGVTLAGLCGVGTGSSLRYKTNVVPLENPLGLLELIEFVWYDRRDGTRQHVPGCIAEQLHKIVPSVVFLDAEGKPESVDYDALGVLYGAAVNILKARTDRHERLIVELVRKIDALEHRLRT